MDTVKKKYVGTLWAHAVKEPIAVIALAASFAAVYFAREQVQVNLPQVVLERLLGFGGPVSFGGTHPEAGQVFAETLHILNTGGRTVTLTVLEKASSPTFLEAAVEGGRSALRATDAYSIEVGVIRCNFVPVNAPNFVLM